MPGLVGIVSNNPLDDHLLDKMVNAIKHEGWHQVDKYSSPFFSAARVDLGIFNPERQPIFNEDRTICIFMYGKIYDYERNVHELKHRGHQFTIGNDAEFCLHSYEEFGKNFVNSLNGSFLITVYDLKRRKVVIANDRYGFRPLYYATSNGKLLFASEVKAILEDKAFKKELNDEAIADFFAFGKILGKKTFFRGVETSPPASVLIHDGENISIEQYWDFHYEPDYSSSEDELIDQLVVAFTKAVKIRMNDNLRYGISLSGGLDSRTVLAAIEQSQRHKVSAFTFGVPGCNELKVAPMVAEKAKVNHLVVELDANELTSHMEEVVYLSDGMDSILVSFIPYVFARVRKRVDVFFMGVALDMLLGGSFLNRSILKAKSDGELLNILYGKMAFFSQEMMAALFTKNYYNYIKDMPFNSLANALHKAKEEHPGNKSDYITQQNHVRRFTILGSVIARNKSEEAIPTYDNKFIETVLKIPPELRYHHHIYRKFLKRLDPELATIPYQQIMVRPDAPLIVWEMGKIYQAGKDRIKKKICHWTRGRIPLASKRNYVNPDEWLRINEKWRVFVGELLLDDRACYRNYLNREYIKTLIQEHELAKAAHSQQLAYLVTFELFLRMFASNQL